MLVEKHERDNRSMKAPQSDFLIDRLATSIVDDSLPLKEVERELRGMVADIAVHQRGLAKKEVASRCGVTEKSIENYLRDSSRTNPKSPEREVARVLQDQALSLEEVYDAVHPVLCRDRIFTLDDAKRALEKLLKTGEVTEQPGRTYRASKQPAIRCPLTDDAYRELVDQKARDLDYIVLNQKAVKTEELSEAGMKRYSRVVGDTNLVRIDFTADVDEEDLPEFYEKLTQQIAKLSLKYEKKKGKSRVRMLLGMRSVGMLLMTLLLTGFLCLTPNNTVLTDDSWELDVAANPNTEDPGADDEDSWELDFQGGADGEADKNPLLEHPVVFVKGDTSSNLRVDYFDGILLIQHLLLGAPILCEDAADVDDNGLLSVGDALNIFTWEFLGTTSSSSVEIGVVRTVDDTEDGLTCEQGLEGLDMEP